MTAATGQRRPDTDRTGSGGWTTVAGQECRELWLGGRGPLLLFAYCVLLSLITYLSATNQVLNFLEQRETVNVILQIAVAVGSLVTLIVSADAITGERERGTLESLLLSPVSRRSIALGKLAAAMSLWLATWLAALPYVWVLGRGVSVVVPALVLGLVVGSLLALALACAGMLISARAGSNKVSLGISLFVLLALFAPTQLPTGAQQGWLGDFFVRVNPVGAGLHYISGVLTAGHSWTADLAYLVSPVATAIVAGAVLALAGDRLVSLQPGGGA